MRGPAQNSNPVNLKLESNQETLTSVKNLKGEEKRLRKKQLEEQRKEKKEAELRELLEMQKLLQNIGNTAGKENQTQNKPVSRHQKPKTSSSNDPPEGNANVPDKELEAEYVLEFDNIPANAESEPGYSSLLSSSLNMLKSWY